MLLIYTYIQIHACMYVHFLLKLSKLSKFIIYFYKTISFSDGTIIYLYTHTNVRYLYM